MPHNFETDKDKKNYSGIKIIRIELATIYNHVGLNNNDKGLVCINPIWPPYDRQIIILCIITSEQMKIVTCIMCQIIRIEISKPCIYMTMALVDFASIEYGRHLINHVKIIRIEILIPCM